MDVLHELKSLRDYLAAAPGERRHVTDAAVAHHRPPPPPAGDALSPSPPPQPFASQPPRPQSPPGDWALQRQVAALRKQLDEGEARCRRAEEAVATARHDGERAAQRLQAQLQAKHEEGQQLAGLVLTLQQEAECLRHQLHCSQHAECGSQCAMASDVAGLRQAAEEWRRQGAAALEALAEEQARSAALQRQLHDEGRARQAAAAEAAALRAVAGAPAASAALLAQLKQRLRTERGWRKAVCRWLQGEVQMRGDLERMLVGISADCKTASCGRGGGGGGGAPAPAPPCLPPRPVTTQLVHVTVRSSCSSPTAHMAAAVSVSSPTARGGICCSGIDSGSTDWRHQFHATVRAFDERHCGKLRG